MASSTVAGRAYSTSRRSMPLLVAHRTVTCQEGGDSVASPRWRPSTRFSSARGSTRSSAPPCSPATGWSVCVLERNDVAGGCIRTSTDLTLPGFTHEVLAVVASALHRLRRLRRAEGRARPARRHVRQHRSPDRHGLPGRLGRVHHGLARGQRGRVRPSRARRRRRLGAPVQRVHGERRPLVRDPLDRALVGRRALARPQGLPPARPPRAARVRRATRSSAAATGSPRRSRRRPPAASSHRGCSTRASARIRRRPAS